MPYLIEFRSGLFDVSAEPKNPVNPVFGHSLLKWLSSRLNSEGIETPDPDYEDWGWYFDVSGYGSNYLVGAASVTHDEGTTDEPIDWMVQVHKHRRMLDKVLGKNKLEGADPLCRLIERIVRSEPSFEDVRASLEP